MTRREIICPGCRVKLYSEDNKLDPQFNALIACRELMFELSYYTLSLQDNYFIHQLGVDSYAAQHAGTGVKPISTAFALVGLYLVNEQNYTGKQVQITHVALAKKSKIWPQFSIPNQKNWLTVQDVVLSPNDKKQEMIKKWCKSVWNVWKSEEEKVSGLINKYLTI